MATTAELLDVVTLLLSKGLHTQDPKVTATSNFVQRSYFASMNHDELLFVHDLLSGYTDEEQKACSQFLLVIERELNDQYVTWLCGGDVDCATPAYMVRNAIYLIPTLLALNITLRLPAENISRGTLLVAKSEPETSVEVLAGRIIAEELTGRVDLDYDDEHLHWVNAHRDALLPFAAQIRTAGSVDRAFYESLSGSHPAITEGVL